GSLDNKHTKFPDRICATCNNARTQPHDLGWEILSSVLQNRRLVPGTSIRANRIWSYDTARQMLNGHLYFVKQFGCMIQEGRAPIHLAPFAAAIMNNKAYAGVWLRFGVGPTLAGNSMVGRSKMLVTEQYKGGPCIHASWIYNVNGAAVQITYTATRMKS